MGNNTSHYFGAYLEISVKERKVMHKIYQCKNGHRYGGAFCNACGEKMGTVDVPTVETPAHVMDILPMSHEDVLSVITPPSLFKTGVIIAIGNLVDVDDENGEWMGLPSYGDECEVKDFPDHQDIQKMKLYLESNYTGVINALKESSAVRDVKIKCGYVLDAEY